MKKIKENLNKIGNKIKDYFGKSNTIVFILIIINEASNKLFQNKFPKFIPLFTYIILLILSVIFMKNIWVYLEQDLTNTDSFRSNLNAASMAYIIISSIVIWLSWIHELSFWKFFLITIFLLAFWYCYYKACMKILNKLNINNSKVGCYTFFKSMVGSLGAWSTIATILFNVKMSNKGDFVFLLPQVLSSAVAFFYPVIDMYIYTYEKINESQKGLQIIQKKNKYKSKDNKK